MFGSLKTLISSFVDDAKLQKQPKGKNWMVAATALLIRVANVEGQMSVARRRKLQAVLKSSFTLDDSNVARLIDDAYAADPKAEDLYQFTRPLREAVAYEGRRPIVKMMWEITYADGNPNELDRAIIWRAADLLGVFSRQNIELRRQVAADRVALPC